MIYPKIHVVTVCRILSCFTVATLHLIANKNGDKSKNLINPILKDVYHVQTQFSVQYAKQNCINIY